MVSDVVHDESGGVHVPQNHAVIASLADAAPADHDLTQNGDVLQDHVSQAHTGSDVEVAAHHRIPQGDARGSDGHVAPHVPQALDARFLDRGPHRIEEHDSRLSPGDGILGVEAAVGIAADQIILGRGGHQPPAPGAQVPAVGETDIFAYSRLHHQVPGQHHCRLLPGHRIQGRKSALRGPRDVASGVTDVHVLGVPRLFRHIVKGDPPHLVVAEGAVDDRNELRPGDVALRHQVAVDISPHEPQLGDPLDIGVQIGRLSLLRPLPHRQGRQSQGA